MPQISDATVEEIGWHMAKISWDVNKEDGLANLSHFKVDLYDGSNHHQYVTKGMMLTYFQ